MTRTGGFLRPSGRNDPAGRSRSWRRAAICEERGQFK